MCQGMQLYRTIGLTSHAWSLYSLLRSNHGIENQDVGSLPLLHVLRTKRDYSRGISVRDADVHTGTAGLSSKFPVILHISIGVALKNSLG